jgi:hypothetical protein
MPVPIPQETDPFAEPGKWVFVNIEWLPIILGTLSYALDDRYWTGSQTEASSVIQSVLQLIDGIGALLPPETVIEKPIYIESEPNNEECEDCMATCNCGNAANVRFCDGKLEYKDATGAWVSVPLIADSVTPSTPTDEELPEPSSGIACAKAHALFDVVADYMEVLARTAPEAIDSPLGDFINFTVGNNNYIWYARFLADESSLPAKAWDFNIAVALWTYGLNMGDIDTLWQGVKEVMQENFVCEWQNKLGKLAKLETSELEAFRAIEWDSGNADLDKVLNGITTRIATSEHIKERVALYAQNGGYVCNCDGDTPIPPPATEPESGEFGLYAGEIVGSIATSMTPAGSRTHGTPRGTKVSETKYTAPPYDAGIDQHATIFVMWEATEMLTQVSLEMLWKYTGSPSDGSNQAVWDFKFYYSTGESSNWQLLPGFVGELASNDSSAPGQFFGAVNFQNIPWDDAIMSTDMLYIGVWMRFGIPSDNTLGIIPGGELTIQTFKAKADSGGNYRASLIPMVFVPKAL